MILKKRKPWNAPIFNQLYRTEEFGEQFDYYSTVDSCQPNFRVLPKNQMKTPRPFWKPGSAKGRKAGAPLFKGRSPAGQIASERPSVEAIFPGTIGFAESHRRRGTGDSRPDGLRGTGGAGAHSSSPAADPRRMRGIRGKNRGFKFLRNISVTNETGSGMTEVIPP